MTNRIRLGVFDRYGVRRQFWAHPLSNYTHYTDVDYWNTKAKLLDDAGFDFLFLADVLGYGMGKDGNLEPTGVREGSTVGRLNPLAIIPAMAAATRDLTFIATLATGLEPPVEFARSLTSFDHVTKGRIAWNIVTGVSADSMANLFGQDQVTPHSERYAKAADFLTVAMKYWEGCWEDTALREDVEQQIFADPDKIRRVDHDGPYYRSSGYFSADPSPQRTPVLVQAGTSEDGKNFAAKYAEAVFLQDRLSEHVADIRERAVSYGRRPEDIIFFTDARVFAEANADEANRTLAEYHSFQSEEGAASAFRTVTGIDLLPLDRDKPLTQLPREKLVTELSQVSVERFIAKPGEPEITVREILQSMGRLGPVARGSIMSGTGPEVAEKLIEFVDSNNIDGVMLDPVFDLHTLQTFSEYVIPELAARGRFSRPTGETARARMTGHGDRLAATHPGAAYRLQPTEVS